MLIVSLLGGEKITTRSVLAGARKLTVSWICLCYHGQTLHESGGVLGAYVNIESAIRDRRKLHINAFLAHP